MVQKYFIFSSSSSWNEALICLFWVNAEDYVIVHGWLAGLVPSQAKLI